MGKITDFRKTNKVQGVGLYRITDIVFPEGQLKMYNDKLGGIYVNNNVYPSAELKMLSEFGVTYTVKGVLGSSEFGLSVQRTDDGGRRRRYQTLQNGRVDATPTIQKIRFG